MVAGNTSGRTTADEPVPFAAAMRLSRGQWDRVLELWQRARDLVEETDQASAVDHLHAFNRLREAVLEFEEAFPGGEERR